MGARGGEGEMMEAPEGRGEGGRRHRREGFRKMRLTVQSAAEDGSLDRQRRGGGGREGSTVVVERTGGEGMGWDGMRRESMAVCVSFFAEMTSVVVVCSGEGGEG